MLVSNRKPLRGIEACVFDAYGTLFDYASAAARCRDALGDKADLLTRRWRDKQLQYTWLRTLQGQFADFWRVTGDALDFAMEELGVDDPALRTRLMNLYLELEPFPDVIPTLSVLKSKGLKTAILSNGSPNMLAAIVSNANLGRLLDASLSVDEVGKFKTHPDVYRLAVERLGSSPASIAFVSSNGWDAYAASAFGMRVFWCNRYAQQPERLPGTPDIVVRSLEEIPTLISG